MIGVADFVVDNSIVGDFKPCLNADSEILLGISLVPRTNSCVTFSRPSFPCSHLSHSLICSIFSNLFCISIICINMICVIKIIMHIPFVIITKDLQVKCCIVSSIVDSNSSECNRTLRLLLLIRLWCWLLCTYSG